MEMLRSNSMIGIGPGYAFRNNMILTKLKEKVNRCGAKLPEIPRTLSICDIGHRKVYFKPSKAIDPLMTFETNKEKPQIEVNKTFETIASQSHRTFALVEKTKSSPKTVENSIDSKILEFVKTNRKLIRNIIAQNKQLKEIWREGGMSRRIIESYLRYYYFLHHNGMISQNDHDDKSCTFVPKEREFEEFVRFYDGSSHRIFLDSIQKYYKFLGFGENNPLMEIDSTTFRKLVFTISACKFDDSETTDFEGFLKIKKSFTSKVKAESLIVTPKVNSSITFRNTSQQWMKSQ